MGNGGRRGLSGGGGRMRGCECIVVGGWVMDGEDGSGETSSTGVAWLHAVAGAGCPLGIAGRGADMDYGLFALLRFCLLVLDGV